LQRELFVWRLLFAVVAAGAMIAAAAPQSTHDNPAKLLYVQPISPSATNKLALQKLTDYDFLQLFHWWSKKKASGHDGGRAPSRRQAFSGTSDDRILIA